MGDLRPGARTGGGPPSRSGREATDPAAAAEARQRLHEALQTELNAAGALDWSKAVIDSSHVQAVKGGPKRGEPG